MANSLKELITAPVRWVYWQWLRDELPYRMTAVAGVAAPHRHIGDVILGGLSRNHDNYKREFIGAVRDAVPGQRVVEIGTGHGITLTHMLRSNAACVDSYEADATRVKRARKTLTRDPHLPSERATVHHGIVGEMTVESVGKAGPRVTTEDVPPFDVLVLDCEGAEIDVLEALSAPETAVVETHPECGVPTSETIEALERIGLAVIKKTVLRDDQKSVVVAK
jgi:hypothetical protein